jgi:hypothetical protein
MKNTKTNAKRFLTPSSLASLLLVAGCASITGSKNQPVSVNSVCDGEQVKGASCTLTNDKGSWFVKTPGSVVISKSTGDLAVTCKFGDSSQSATFQSKSNGGVWGNLIAGGIIGYAVDASSGAGFDYPPSMTVQFSENCALAKASGNGKGDVESRLRNLNNLLERGLITENEFKTRRKKVLGDL